MSCLSSVSECWSEAVGVSRPNQYLTMLSIIFAEYIRSETNNKGDNQ